MHNTPRVERVVARKPTTLRIKWRHGRSEDIELAGWIATGGDILARLNDSGVFGKARVTDYGAAVAWDDDDLRIDAVHLDQLAQEQRPFGPKEASEWQRTMQLSNQEAAALLDIAVSTWECLQGARQHPQRRGDVVPRSATRPDHDACPLPTTPRGRPTAQDCVSSSKRKKIDATCRLGSFVPIPTQSREPR
jgi:hypothetical protein